MNSDTKNTACRIESCWNEANSGARTSRRSLGGLQALNGKWTAKGDATNDCSSAITDSRGREILLPLCAK